MRIFNNITRDDLVHQGVLQRSLSSYGMEGRLTTETLELGELLHQARANRCEAILVTNPRTLKNIVSDPKPALDDWRGSVLQTSIPIVISNPLAHTQSTILGNKLHQIDITRLKGAPQASKFLYDFSICRSTSEILEAEAFLSRPSIEMIVADIETNFHNQITSIAFTPIMDSWAIGKSYVISLMPNHYPTEQDTLQAWDTVRLLCESAIPTVFHNGTFDCFHLLRYGIQVENYIYDTEYIWRAWHAEMPKALAKVCSYLLPDYYYWKHESELSPLEYNAKDTINTARILIYMLKYAPDWVWTNYAQLYPNIGPVLYTAFEGFLVDKAKLKDARAEAQADLDTDLEELRESIGIPTFNPGSPQQVSALLYGILRARKPKRSKSKAATGETELKAVARQHPFYAWIITRILGYRGNKKAISTYYDALLTSQNRLLYSHSLDGTETARMACNASSLYALKPNKKTYVKSNMTNYGTQVMNVPYYHKKALMADPGYVLLGKDKSQSEARCVGYMSACQDLVDALENPPPVAGTSDFYCYVGYRFFGVEFDKSSPLRQAVKKIIHGTNYLMGIYTFIDAAGDKGVHEGKIVDGIANLQKYKMLLGYRGTIPEFASHLLGLYHELYPEVSQRWDALKLEVIRTGRLVTPDGWVRLVEGDIQKHHSILRGLVAHGPQHWSVWGINRAFWRLFYELQVPSKGEYRLKCQVHDSIVSQCKEERLEYYSQEMEKIMDIPQTCEYGTMRIPLDTETGKYWKE